MAFHTAEYDTYVFLGNPASTPLWHWSAWQKVMPQLDALLAPARGPVSVRSTQILADRSPVRFGRIGWKERDQQKWTHGSPVSAEESATWKFLSTELWAPIWTQCTSEKLSPDVFLSISGEPDQTVVPSFKPLVVLAIVAGVATREPERVGNVTTRIAGVMAAKLVAFQRRTWGRAAGGIGFNKSIQDLRVTGLFKPGRLHDKPVDLNLFADKWQELPADRPVPPKRAAAGLFKGVAGLFGALRRPTEN